MSTEAMILAGVAAATLVSVPLDTPIARGDAPVIETLQLRKPGAGELRGLNMVDLIKMDVSATIAVLPRITMPPITTAEAAAMDPADLFACGTEVAHFLLQRASKPDFPS